MKARNIHTGFNGTVGKSYSSRYHQYCSRRTVDLQLSSATLSNPAGHTFKNSLAGSACRNVLYRHYIPALSPYHTASPKILRTQSERVSGKLDSLQHGGQDYSPSCVSTSFQGDCVFSFLWSGGMTWMLFLLPISGAI